MAKKAKKMVTVNDLADKHGMDGRKIRMIIRASGRRAPAVEKGEGEFGPRAKYEWAAGSKELKEIEKLIVEAKAAEPKPEPKKGKKKTSSKKKASKKEEDEEEEEEEEEEEDEDEEEEEEDEEEDEEEED